MSCELFARPLLPLTQCRCVALTCSLTGWIKKQSSVRNLFHFPIELRCYEPNVGSACINAVTRVYLSHPTLTGGGGGEARVCVLCDWRGNGETRRLEGVWNSVFISQRLSGKQFETQFHADIIKCYAPK